MLVLAVVFFLIGQRTQDERASQVFLNLTSEFVGVALVFFLVQLFFGYNPEQYQRERQESFVAKVEDYLARMKEIRPLRLRESLYDAAGSILDSSDWDKIHLYVPDGIWIERQERNAWLERLAEKARKDEKIAVLGVFGLPPTMIHGYKRQNNEEIAKEVKNVWNVLYQFSGLRNVVLRYCPPAPASIGFEAVIFVRKDGTGQALFGLATEDSEEPINTGLILTNPDVCGCVLRWFREKILEDAVSEFALQDVRQPLYKRWYEIMVRWYPEIMEIRTPGIPQGQGVRS